MKHTDRQIDAGTDIVSALAETHGEESALTSFENLCIAMVGESWTAREIYHLRDAVISKFRSQHES